MKVSFLDIFPLRSPCLVGSRCGVGVFVEVFNRAGYSRVNEIFHVLLRWKAQGGYLEAPVTVVEPMDVNVPHVLTYELTDFFFSLH